MNDDANIDPVDLSPTRAELIARVRRRGRQIRARRRLAMTALSALVVVAIAAPAIAIGTRSSSHSVPPATVAATKGDLRMAVVVRESQGGSCAVTSFTDGTSCYVLGRTIATARDVQDVAVAYDATQGWVLNMTLAAPAIRRLAAPVGHQVAIVVAGKVQSAPTVHGRITGRGVQISTGHLTRAQAIALATKILGRAPAHVDPEPAVSVTSTIELPGNIFTAGTPVHGTLVVDNNSGHPYVLRADTNGCMQPWGIALTNATIPPDIAFALPCIQGKARVLSTGEHSFPFTMSTSYSSCTAGNRASPRCLPNGAIPPLPAGDYEAVLVPPAGLYPTPPAVPVRLVEAAVAR